MGLAGNMCRKERVDRMDRKRRFGQKPVRSCPIGSCVEGAVMQYRFIARTVEIVNHIIKILWQAYRSGKPHEIIIREYDAKSREQEEKYHAMIGDIARQMRYHGEKLDRESLKRLLVEAFVQVMRETAQAGNKPDPFGGQARLLMSLDGQRVVQLGVQTRRFRKDIASEFIEYLYAYGTENGVRFTGKDYR